MRAHLVQLNIAWEDRAANFRRVRELLDHGDVQPGDFVLLPETFDTGFSMNTAKTADHEGATLAFLRETAVAHRVTIQAGRTVREHGADTGDITKASNEMTVIAPDGRTLCRYVKIHPFSLGREQDFFAGGQTVMTYELNAKSAERPSTSGTNAKPPDPNGIARTLRVCPATCYDLRFPELFRRGLTMGAELFAIGACWLDTRQAHWRTLAIARAIENQAYVLAVNRTGPDPNANYIGGTIAVGPRGDVLGELGADEGVLSAEIDRDEVRRWREKFPAWKDAKLLT